MWLGCLPQDWEANKSWCLLLRKLKLSELYGWRQAIDLLECLFVFCCLSTTVVKHRMGFLTFWRKTYIEIDRITS